MIDLEDFSVSSSLTLPARRKLMCIDIHIYLCSLLLVPKLARDVFQTLVGYACAELAL